MYGSVLRRTPRNLANNRPRITALLLEIYSRWARNDARPVNKNRTSASASPPFRSPRFIFIPNYHPTISSDFSTSRVESSRVFAVATSRFLPSFLFSFLFRNFRSMEKIVSTQLPLPSSSSPFPFSEEESFLKDVDKLAVCFFAGKGGIEK